ncbi:MAG: hypothetical protein OEW29_02580, partial [Acidimicrobiia bacterium]|nr:hypothetical protein [Acidimicrobiia bacterium]
APSKGMLDDARLRPLIDKYLAGADDLDAEKRAAVFRLAWDFCGSALAGRHGLYERFYLGSAARNKKTLYMNAEGTMTGEPGPVKVWGDELVEGMLTLGRTATNASSPNTAWRCARPPGAPPPVTPGPGPPRARAGCRCRAAPTSPRPGRRRLEAASGGFRAGTGRGGDTRRCEAAHSWCRRRTRRRRPHAR